MDSCSQLLQTHGFSQYVEMFEREGITLPLLLDLKDSHMKEMGLSIGERIRLKRIVNFYRRKQNRKIYNSIVLNGEEKKNKFFTNEGVENGPKKILLVGHRGACGYEPENTLRAFTRAIEMGCDAIELDVHMCKTGEIIVIHDKELDRTTSGNGSVGDKTLEELKQLDAGKGEKIPTLNEVLDLINDRITVNIELKGYGTLLPVVNLLKDYFGRGFSPSKIILTSFIHQYAKEARLLLPYVQTGLLIRSELLGFAALAEAADSDYLVTYYEYANANVIEDAHSRGIKVMCYTVNDVAMIKQLKDLGVDGIITNYPDRFFDAERI